MESACIRVYLRLAEGLQLQLLLPFRAACIGGLHRRPASVAGRGCHRRLSLTA
jgi:hypothetical protein